MSANQTLNKPAYPLQNQTENINNKDSLVDSEIGRLKRHDNLSKQPKPKNFTTIPVLDADTIKDKWQQLVSTKKKRQRKVKNET